MDRQNIQTETTPEEIKEYLRKMEEKKQRDLLWSGDRTIKQTYSTLSSIYSDLAKVLGRDISLYSGIISEYYRQKSEKVSTDGRLADRLYTPGWETLQTLLSLPTELLSENKRKLQEETDSPIYGTAISIVREVGKVIRDYLPTLSPEVSDPSLFPESPSMEEREDYIIQDRIAVLRVLQKTQKIEEEIVEVWDKVSPGLRKRFAEYTLTTGLIKDQLTRYLGKGLEDISLVEAKRRYSNSKDLDSALSELIEEKDRYYKTQIINGETRIIEYKSAPLETSVSALDTFIEEARKASLKYQSGLIKVPKDLMEVQINTKTSGDMLLIGTDKQKEQIKKLQAKGKLLAGTLEGLSGGDAYLKTFIIALAKTLNEQSQYYNADGDWSGVPKDLISERIGKEVEIHREEVTIKGEKRQYPYIVIIYADMAKKMSKTGKISGGKDVEFIRQYINGYTEIITNEKTGRTKEVNIPGIIEKEYILDLGNVYGGVPLLKKEMTIYAKGTGKELGCIYSLSPQFSKTIRGYSALRSDTIQLLGGGKQKEITMDLIDMLIFNRGVVQKGRKEGEFGISKDKILKKYENMGLYLKDGYVRKKELERDFQTAIQKAIEAKILLPGKKKDGTLNGYREEKTGGIISVFTYNPDYLKGEIISPDEQ